MIRHVLTNRVGVFPWVRLKYVFIIEKINFNMEPTPEVFFLPNTDLQ